MFMYIVCVFCSFLLFSNSSCFVFLFQTKKNEKKNIVALTQYSRARIFPHTLFDFKKLQVSRQDLYFSPYKKLSLSFSLLAGASRHPCHLSRVPLSLLPRKNLSVCLSQAFRLASNRNTLPESKGKRTVPFILRFPQVTRFPHGGGHRSSQVGTHVRRCPRLRLLRIR